jgi:catechol 2,3-dioxygenase-like lactoylglutathione lyase family enzyme
MPKVTALDHVQVAMPQGQEAAARAFYGGVLGLPEIAKPESLAARGGVWFQCGHQQLHLGVEEDFRPAKKAHPAFWWMT